MDPDRCGRGICCGSGPGNIRGGICAFQDGHNRSDDIAGDGRHSGLVREEGKTQTFVVKKHWTAIRERAAAEPPREQKNQKGKRGRKPAGKLLQDQRKA